MFKSFWSRLEPETKRTILIIAPVVVLGFLALLHIHPLVTLACVVGMGIYGVGFFTIELSREYMDKLKKRWNSHHHTDRKI
ncbi:hypothetical protein [Priestia megaterium]|uniref:hypothetical protein n=1 Tax=Priestia megaterium TaxID=1404 RepID=UPI0036721FB8